MNGDHAGNEVEQCSSTNSYPPPGIRCLLLQGHTGRHVCGMFQWGGDIVTPETRCAACGARRESHTDMKLGIAGHTINMPGSDLHGVWHAFTTQMIPLAVVEHPQHYGGDTVYEHIKVAEAWGLGYALGNATKYIARAGKKDPAKHIEDLKKARWYLDYEIQRLERLCAEKSGD